MKPIEVISPLGGEVIRQNTVAPRLADLNGKTVCEIWNGGFKGDYTFPVLRELLKVKYPGVKIVPYTEFPFSRGADSAAHLNEHARQVAALAKEKGCHVLISGNGA